MKEAPGRTTSVFAVHQERRRNAKIRFSTERCSICLRHVWFSPIYLMEPEGVPTPRLSWTLCKRCHHALDLEMQNSPILSPLRLRIAMGMVASSYWPNAYPTRVRAYISDRKWIVFMASGFIIAMLLHLVVFVMIGTMR